MIDSTRILGEFLRTNIAAPASTTLSSGINASTLTIAVTDGAQFAAYDAPLALKIDSEIVLGTRSGNTITVDLGARGSLATAAATHSNGATISIANLYAICGSAIWPDKLPTGFNNTAPTILFRIRGGAGPDPSIPVSTYSFEFFCYGGTKNYDDTLTVARALHDRLHGVTTYRSASGTILHAHEEVPIQNVTEIDTEYPRAFTAYGVELRSL